jgi:hypothetical protein
MPACAAHEQAGNMYIATRARTQGTSHCAAHEQAACKSINYASFLDHNMRVVHISWGGGRPDGTLQTVVRLSGEVIT